MHYIIRTLTLPNDPPNEGKMTGFRIDLEKQHEDGSFEEKVLIRYLLGENPFTIQFKIQFNIALLIFNLLTIFILHKLFLVSLNRPILPQRGSIIK